MTTTRPPPLRPPPCAPCFIRRRTAASASAIIRGTLAAGMLSRQTPPHFAKCCGRQQRIFPGHTTGLSPQSSPSRHILQNVTVSETSKRKTCRDQLRQIRRATPHSPLWLVKFENIFGKYASPPSSINKICSCSSKTVFNGLGIHKIPWYGVGEII